jgi:hypothetical protein
MDRTIVYPGAIPLDTDLLSAERGAMIAIGYLAQATLGTNVVADGLICSPTSPLSLSVSVGPGSITAFTVVDITGFGSLPAEPAEPLVKMGINANATTLTLAPPTQSGQAITYLIEAAMAEIDSLPVLLPYYNAANPSMPYSGPNNDGLAQNTVRTQSVQLQLKAGPPGASGSQSTPIVDAGWVGLYTIVVTAGQTEISINDIVTLPTAPFVQWKLPQLTPGTHNLAIYTPANQGDWMVPAGVSSVRVRAWGGGGAGGAGFGGGGGGGAGGGYSEGYFSVISGQTIVAAVGTGGVGSGAAGGSSSFGSMSSATGGAAGGNGAAGAAGSGGTAGGNGAGGSLVIAGQPGSAAIPATSGWVGGTGGGSFGGAGARGDYAASSADANGAAGILPGAGGAGGVGGGVGGQGGAGLIIIEW